MSSLCLNMIVKNESAIIERCLSSIKPHVDAWMVCDTGSSDDTIDKVQSVMNDLPGAIIREPFVDFSTTRNYALETAKRSTLNFDYLLLCDADMELVVEKPDWTENLTSPSYLLTQKSKHLTYRNVRLVDRKVESRYVGPTHEVLEVPGRANLDGAYFIDHVDGKNRKDKFVRDIKLLANAPKNTRNIFYLAQSHRDLKNYDKALELYSERVKRGGWKEEVYISLYNIAILKSRLNHTFEDIYDTYKQAIKLNPSRAEAIHGAAKLCRENEYHGEGYGVAKLGVHLEQPEGLFIENWIYEYGLLDEFSICAYYAGHPLESFLAAKQILSKVDKANYNRVRMNLEFSRKAC